MISPERNTLESLLALAPDRYRKPVDETVLSRGATLSDGTKLKFAGAVSTFHHGTVACFIREDQALDGVEVMNPHWLKECRGACLISGVDNGLLQVDVIVPEVDVGFPQPTFKTTGMSDRFRRTA